MMMFRDAQIAQLGAAAFAVDTLKDFHTHIKSVVESRGTEGLAIRFKIDESMEETPLLDHINEVIAHCARILGQEPVPVPSDPETDELAEDVEMGEPVAGGSGESKGTPASISLTSIEY